MVPKAMPPTTVRRDLVPPEYPRIYIVVTIKFVIQPDDGQHTGPKRVVVKRLPTPLYIYIYIYIYICI